MSPGRRSGPEPKPEAAPAVLDEVPATVQHRMPVRADNAPDLLGDLARLQLDPQQTVGVQLLGLQTWRYGCEAGLDIATVDGGHALRHQGHEQALDELCSAAATLGRASGLEVPLAVVLDHVHQTARAEHLRREVDQGRTAWWRAARNVTAIDEVRRHRGEAPHPLHGEVPA